MKRVLAATVLTLVAPSAVAQSTTDAFDLTCTGERTEKTLRSEEKASYTKHYRVDLARKKWCDDECKAVRDIYEVQPTFLTLQVIPDGPVTSYTRIDRETGEHMMGQSIGRGAGIISTGWEGTCERAAFSGFPTFETKF